MPSSPAVFFPRRLALCTSVAACFVSSLALTACGGGSETSDDTGASRATISAASTALADRSVTASALTASATPTAAPPQPPVSACSTATGRRLTVGPAQTYATPSAAAAVALTGDVIVIQAGDYTGDVAVWPQSNLTICGNGGRARLFAGGRNAAGKGIWVIQGSNVVVENVEFHNATVPDRNGAGIRAEGNGLTVRNAGFYDNENGILGPNAGDLTIESSEFARNGYGDGYSHNIYVGTADHLTVNYSYFHEAKVGHNLKSRAHETRISNSYFMDGPSGTSSYLINVPNGGLVVLRGNMLHKGPMAQNSNVIAYGEEGMPWAVNTLEMSNNTLVSQRSGGTFVLVAAGVQSVSLSANIFAGTNGPAIFNASVGGQVTQKGSLVGTAADIPGADNLSTPNFYPTTALAARLPLRIAADLTYDRDAPQPYTVRMGSQRGNQLTGALQSRP